MNPTTTAAEPPRPVALERTSMGFEKLAWTGLALTVLVLLAVQMMTFRVVHPQVDDWLRMRLGVEQGVYKATVSEYHRWSGRWLATATVAWTGAQKHAPAFVGVVAAAIWLTFIGSIIAASVRWLRWAPVLVRAAFGLTLAMLFWTRAPSVGGGVFWLTGATENTMGWAMLALALAICPSPSRGLGPVSWARAAVAGLLAFLGTGCHEIVGVAAIPLIAVAIPVSVVKPRGTSKAGGLVLLPVFLGVIAGFVLVYRAPGNAARIASTGGMSTPPKAVALAVVEAIQNYPAFLADLGLVALCLVAISYAPRQARADLAGPDSQPRWTLWPAALCLVASALVLGAACYAVSSRIPGRTLNSVYIVVMGAAGLFVALTGPAAAVRLDRLAPAWRAIRVPLLLALCVALLGGRNAGRAWIDVTKRLSDYRNVMREREQLISTYRTAVNKDAVLTLPHVVYYPLLLQAGDITTDPSYYINQQYAQFLGVPAVRSTGESYTNERP